MTDHTAPTWRHVQVLVTGALLAQGPRTVATVLLDTERVSACHAH